MIFKLENIKLYAFGFQGLCRPVNVIDNFPLPKFENVQTFPSPQCSFYIPIRILSFCLLKIIFLRAWRSLKSFLIDPWGLIIVCIRRDLALSWLLPQMCVCVCVYVWMCSVRSDSLWSDSKDCCLLVSSVRGIFKQEYWTGLPFPALGHLPNPEIKPMSVT